MKELKTDKEQTKNMRKLVLAILCCLIGMASYGQRVDFSTYDHVIKRGKVSIVCHNDEYRMIIGSLKNPKLSILMGMSPEAAAGCLNSLLRKEDNKEFLHKAMPVGLGGIRFAMRMSGPSSNRTFSLSGLDDSVRFKMSAQGIKAMKQAILDFGIN